MPSADRETIAQISALRQEMVNADNTLKTDYENRSAELNSTLSAETQAIRTQIGTLETQYQT